MMSFDSAITRVSAVDPTGASAGASAAGALVKPEAGGAASGLTNGAAQTNTVAAPASAEQADKFKAMLDQATLNAQTRPHAASGSSAIANVVDSQDAAFNDLNAQMQTFQAEAPTMDPRAFSAEMVNMQFKVADAMARIELGVGFAQGGKSAVQNLMKNQ
jgi:type III secretion system HrpB2-like protein